MLLLLKCELTDLQPCGCCLGGQQVNFAGCNDKAVPLSSLGLILPLLEPWQQLLQGCSG